MTLLAALNIHSLFFLFYALLAIGFAVAVVATSNIVRMAFYLTLSLGATAGLFFLAGAEFIGAMQLLIYVGGTLVLLIFGVMLTAQARFISMQTSGAEWVLAAIVGGSLLLLLLQSAYSIPAWNTPRANYDDLTIFDARSSTPIGLALTGVRVDKLHEPNEVLRRGLSGYLFPFVIVSMHLLVVLIGAGYMARTKRFRHAALSSVPPVARPARRHRASVMGGIVSGIIANVILAAVCLWHWLRPPAATGVLGRIHAALEPAADWLWPLLAVLFLLNVILLLVVHGWQRWGVIALGLVALAQGVAIGNSGLPPLWGFVFFVLAMLPVVALISALRSPPRPTEWELME
jgi:NADH-quinone oxidoreductase subunit J